MTRLEKEKLKKKLIYLTEEISSRDLTLKRLQREYEEKLEVEHIISKQNSMLMNSLKITSDNREQEESEQNTDHDTKDLS